jgi:hypothetical protein
MTETLACRRHADGSIDYDFYRARAAGLRRKALGDFGARPASSVRPLVMAGALGFAVVIPSIATAPHDHAAAAQFDRR